MLLVIDKIKASSTPKILPYSIIICRVNAGIHKVLQNSAKRNPLIVKWWKLLDVNQLVAQGLALEKSLDKFALDKKFRICK